MNPAISVIVPVYNTEPYLRRCIDSILAQTFTDFELLLIDDGSTDRSGELCDEFAEKDSRIRVFHKKNGGSNCARFFGVTKAFGEWIAFVDSDDEIKPPYLQTLYNGNHGDKYDIIIGNANKTFDLDIDRARHSSIRIDLIPSVPWGRLVRASLFDQTIFDIPYTIKMGEDLLMNLRLSFKTNKPFKMVTGNYYRYNVTPGSISQKFIPTIEQEICSFNALVKSIPRDKIQLYEKDIFVRQMFGLREICIASFLDMSWRKTKYFRDCKETALKLGVTKTRYKIILHGNRIILSIYILMIKIKRNLKRFNNRMLITLEKVIWKTNLI